MVHMIGDPEAVDLVQARREGKIGHPSRNGQGHKGRVEDNQPALRMPDPNFEDSHLYAGKFYTGTGWHWFRLGDPRFGKYLIQAEKCDDVRVAIPEEAARMEQYLTAGRCVLVDCKLNGELYAKIVRPTGS